MQASGTFTVDAWEPETPYDQHDGIDLGHTTLRKTFAGDLVGTSEVHMVSAMVAGTRSAAYGAIERVDGTLAGRTGTFVLQHSATATADSQSLTITVVPDTGTGELTGIAGTLTIDRTDGQHNWTFDYTIG
ncbi:DUF3224 domain-containing protein [Actinokineospora inagensis]|uniref:DUF3224 domain-containing protein n=1 Tax=Actinokineospora inagensis TaxID=103730 RepID=UPI0003FAA1CF|nr:DUF3224 domain-containing protein [Actinokineospora inagensis]